MVNKDSTRILRKLVEVQVICIFSLVLFGRGLATFVLTLIDNHQLEYVIGGVLCLALFVAASLGTIKGVSRWIRLIFCLLVLLAAGSMLVSAEEALHLLLYGLLSFTTLKLSEAESRTSPVLRAFLFAFFVGFLDEFLQALHPQRFFDLRDIALNGVGAAIGLLGSFSPIAGGKSSLKKPPSYADFQQ